MISVCVKGVEMKSTQVGDHARSDRVVTYNYAGFRLVLGSTPTFCIVLSWNTLIWSSGLWRVAPGFKGDQNCTARMHTSESSADGEGFDFVCGRGPSAGSQRILGLQKEQGISMLMANERTAGAKRH